MKRTTTAEALTRDQVLAVKGRNTHVASAEHIGREHVLLLLNAAWAASAKRDRLMILVAYNYGARASEICQLRTTDVDIRNGLITIRRLKGSRTTIHQLVEDGGPLDDKRDLTEWVNTCKHGDRLFKVGRQHFFTQFRKHAQAAGVPRHLWRLHNLRHGCAMALVNKIPLQELQMVLGHVSLASTGIYLKPTQAQVWASVANARKAMAFEEGLRGTV